MDKVTIIRSFNNHLGDFMKDILTIFPSNTDILDASKAIDVMKRLNPTLLIKAWYLHVNTPYQTIIDSGDLSYFYDGHLSITISDKVTTDVMDIIQKLKEPVKNMDDVNKEHSIKYMQNLCKLALLYRNLL